MTPFRVCLSLGRVKRIEEGLGNFFMGLTTAMIQQAARESATHGAIEWHVHARGELHGCLGDQVVYHHAPRLHRLLNPSIQSFDVWHVLHQLNTLRPALRAKRVVTTVHDLNFLYDPQHANPERMLAKIKRILSRADELVCVSEYTRSDLSAQHLSAAPTSVIYNGIDDLTEVQGVPIPSLEGKPFYFHLSRMTPNKNPDLIFELALRRGAETFVFAGAETEHSRAFAERARGVKNIAMLGPVNVAQKAWLYRNCIAFLFPSSAEGFGLPPLEAMQFGTPVVVSNKTSLPEVCGEFAAYINEKSVESINNVLSQLPSSNWADINRARRVSHARSFRWSRAAAAYLSLYRKLWS
jgi:glycosyltransferase involved in cell wall biosynthesis